MIVPRRTSATSNYEIAKRRSERRVMPGLLRLGRVTLSARVSHSSSC